MEDGSEVLWVIIVLDPSDVALDDRALVLDPLALRVLVVLNVARLEVLYVLLKHLFLMNVGCERNGFYQVFVHVFKES